MSPRALPLRPLVTSVFLATLVCLGATGCSQTVSLSPAADANNPACADVIVRLPETVAEKPKRETNAQSTGAWGTPSAVILHCGVAVPGPTTDACISLNGVDWIADESDAENDTYRYTTYGREPAVEVVINADAKTGGVSGTTALIDLTGAVSVIPTTTACVGAEEVLN